MTITKNDIVYCDANFLIAYGASKVKQPDIQKRAYVLFAKLLACKCKIVVSALTFDETWLGMRKDNFDVIQFKNPTSGVMKALKYLKDYSK